MKNGTLSLMGASALALLTTAPVSAAIFNDQLGLAWASNRDLTNAQFAQRSLKLSPAGPGVGIYSFTFVSCEAGK